MAFNDEDCINEIAAQERAIAGVKNSYNYARNPDSLTSNLLPAVIHYIPSFTSEPRGHHNVWKDALTFQSILLVMPREMQGGKLRFIENAAIPYGQKWRDRFHTESVINTLLTNTGSVRAFLTGGDYGAGGPVSFMGTEFVG